MNYQGLNFFVRPKAAHIEPYLGIFYNLVGRHSNRVATYAANQTQKRVIRNKAVQVLSFHTATDPCDKSSLDQNKTRH